MSDAADGVKRRLSTEFALAASRVTMKLSEELRLAMDDIKSSAPKYIEEAYEIEQKAAAYLSDGLAGKIDPDIAQEAARRENEALEFLALKVVEEKAQAALRRMKRVLDTAIDVGLALAKTAITVGIAAV
jgi:hypothetical protein